MSAYGPPQSPYYTGSDGVMRAMPGFSFSGSDPNIRVPRLTGNGEWGMMNPNDPTHANFYGYPNRGEDHPGGGPMDFLDPVIRREDFAPGPEGDQAYRDAVSAFGSGSLSQANRANAATSAGGSSSLAVSSWARNHPEEAFSALLAMSTGAIDDPNAFLDDSTIRDIVTGLGGPEAVNAMMEAERNRLIAEGVIPQSNTPPAGGGHGPGQTPGQPPLPAPDPNDTIPGQVPANSQPNPDGSWTDPNGNIWRLEGGENGAWVPYNPGAYESLYGDPNAPQSPPGPGGKGGPLPANPAAANAVPPNAGNPNARRGPNGEILYPPDATYGLNEPTGRDPYVHDQNGQIVGDAPLPGQYQYTAMGNDVYLDVTNPNTGQVHRFTGDVVQATYGMMGYQSFDEMVLDMGYNGATQMLFSFIAPPAPAPSPRPNPSGPPVGNPGGVGPVGPAPAAPAPTPGPYDYGPPGTPPDAGPVPGFTQ